MSFRNWAIRKLGGYTAAEMAEMEMAADRKLNALEVRLSKVEQQKFDAEIKVKQSRGESVQVGESVVLDKFEIEIPEIVEKAKEDVGRAIGEFMCANNLIHFSLDRELYKDTTQSVVISGNARILR